MMESFPGYYPPSDDMIFALWDDCKFVLDANVFLDLYRYSSTTRDEFIQILTEISERLWIPHQVALEYLKNRPDVILTQVSMYEKARSLLNNLLDRAKQDIDKQLTFKNHPFIEKQDFFEKIEEALIKIGEDLDEQMRNHPQDLLGNDPILTTITNLLNGKVGAPYSLERLKEIYKEGENRYKTKVPPGYKDSEGDNKKEGDEKYGDLVLWFQIVEKAKETEKSIIFITNDQKEDWWWISKGRTIAPRPELVGEIRAKAGVPFHMYNSDRFMNYSREYLGIKVEQAAIDEVQDVRQRDEEDRIAILKSYLEALEAARKRDEAVLKAGIYRDRLTNTDNPENLLKNLISLEKESDFSDDLLDDEIPF